MCQVAQKQNQHDRSFRVYKFAPLGYSEFSPNARSAWLDAPTEEDRYSGGTILRYEVGKYVTSPSGPGIFAYRHPPHPSACRDRVWLELSIPPFTKYREGLNDSRRAPYIAAEEVYVSKVLTEEYVRGWHDGHRERA